MNHITQMNALIKQLKSYKDYVPICPNGSLSKLLNEIQVLMDRIKTIRAMGSDDMGKEVVFFYETKQSKENFKTN